MATRTTTPRSTQRPATPTRPWASLYVMLIALTMAVTGWIALTEGVTRYLPQLMGNNQQAPIEERLQALRSQQDPELLRQYSRELASLSAVTQADRFIDSRLPDHGVYLANMPQLNRALLTSHIFLGVFCMLFGGLQFWPWLRKEHMKVHRAIGGLYVVTAPISVLLSLAYMVVTPPHHLYVHLTGYVALWIFGVLAIASIGLAMWAIRQRRIHEHMAWMAVSFSCLLLAPMLRLNWVFTAWAFPHIDQETLSMVSLGFMMPQCLLIGLGLMWANRQPVVRRRPISAVAQAVRQWTLRAAPLLWAAALAAVVLTFTQFAQGHGLSSLPQAERLMGSALAAREAAAWSSMPWVGALFAASIGLALLLGLGQLLHSLREQPEPPRQGYTPASVVLLLATVLAGGISLHVGWQIGLAPHLQWLNGGTFYVVEGALLMSLAALHAWRVRAGSPGPARESLVLLLSLLPAPALATACLWALSFASLPASYFSNGQVYLLGSSLGSGLIPLAILHAVMGQATREHV